MAVIYVVVAISLVLLTYLYRKQRNSLSMPGPPGLPFLGNVYDLQPSTKLHLIVSDMADKYGPVLKFKLRGTHFVMLSDFDSIYEASVKKGKAFGGRKKWSIRTKLCTSLTGILSSPEPDETWKALRMASQKHLKQFGDGLSRLEKIIKEVAEDNMFSSFQEQQDIAWDPKEVIFKTALYSIVFLISGKKATPNDEFVRKFQQYERLRLVCNSDVPPLKYLIVDLIPGIKWFPIEIMQMIKKMLRLEDELWAKMQGVEDDDSASLGQILLSLSRNPETPITELDAKKSSMFLAYAGVTTTSHTFYGAVNLLAHYPAVQAQLRQEIQRICPNREAGLTDRPEMPYTRAFVYELLRYTSVTPMLVPHRTVKPDTIKGYWIPKDTAIWLNTFHMHHDANFWKDPSTFMPERFLDETEDVVPADHPNRKHLMPFGAGPRVCLGESLALSRLFLWVTTLVSRFHVSPAEDNEKDFTLPNNSIHNNILEPHPYRVIFKSI